MIFTTLLASLGLIAVASAKLTPKVTPNITVYEKDTLQFNLSYVFDLDYDKDLTCISKGGSIAEYIIPNNSISAKDISIYGYQDNPEITKLVSNNTVFAVYDNSQILIQSLTVDQLRFGETHQANFGRPGADAICSDIAYNREDGVLYVACSTKTSDVNPNATLTIKRLNDSNGEVIQPEYTVLLDETKNQKLVHKLGMHMVTLNTGSSTQRGLILYDQGFSSGEIKTNKWGWVLAIGNGGSLFAYDVVNLPSDLQLSSVYDFFGLKNGVLITGKTSSLPNTLLYMSWCTINVDSKVTFNCNEKIISAVFGTTYGYIGMFNTGQYVEINADPDHQDQDLIHICNFKGEWGTSDFIDLKACSSMPSYHIPDDVSIDDVEGNDHQVVVKYTHFDGTYAGYSAHNFDLKMEWSKIDDSLAHHLVPLGKTLMALNRTHLDIHRMVPPYFYVQASHLAAGNNIIRVDCQDSTTIEPVAGKINIYMIESMKDGVYLNGSWLQDFSVYDGERLMLQLDPHLVLGNDLDISVHFDSKIEPYTNAMVYDTEFTNVNWKTTNTSTDFIDIHFSGKYAVTKDSRGWISFHTCMFSQLSIISCVEKGSYNMGGHNVILKKDLNEVFDWQFSWAVDPLVGATFIFIFDGSQVHRHFIYNGVADDCMMTEIGSNAYLACSLHAEGEIRGYMFPQMNPAATPYPVETINRKNSQVDFFCPTDIDFHPQLNYMLEVLSVCPGQDQRILKYRYPPKENVMTKEIQILLVDEIPINFAYENLQICSMGTEYIQYSSVNGKRGDLQSRSSSDDRNSWNFGTLTDDLNLGEIYKLNCIPRAGMFVGLFRTQGAPEKDTLAVFWGNQQYQANHKLYDSKRDNLHHYNFIDSYELRGQVIHVLHDAETNTFNFMVTFTNGPVVDIKFEHGAINSTGVDRKTTMTLSFSNGGSFRQDISKTIQLVDPHIQTQVSTKRKLSANSAGIIELEDYIDIKGPVAHATLSNSTGAHLIGRLHAIGNHAPVEPDHGTFSHLETYQYITIGLRNTQFNVSTMVIFHDIATMVGEYSPAHGVHAFHFATFNNDPESVLVAYSTAEPTDNSLQFVVLKGNSRTAIGFSKAGELYNFTMIKVAPLSGDNNSFLVLGSGADHVVHHLKVTVTGSQISYTPIDTISNVHDFGWAAPDKSDKIYVVYSVQDEYKDVEIAIFDRKSGVLSHRYKDDTYRKAIREISGIDEELTNYNVESLIAKVHNETAFYVVLNTESPYIYEMIYDTENLQNHQVYKYMKMPGHWGRYMDGNRQNFVIDTSSDVAHMDAGSRLIFYTRQSQTNNGSIYPTWSQHNDIIRPFTLTNCPRNNSHFQMATAFEAIPLVFLHVKPMQLNVTDASTLKYAVFDVEGLPHQPTSEIKINDIIDAGSDDDDTSSMAWWPFVLVIGVLILLAVGFIIYKAQKDKAMEADDPENYISLKPEGKDARPSETEA